MLLGLIGYPIRHSLSPVIHQHAFSELGIRGRYTKEEVTEDQVEIALAKARALGYCGLNVTTPYKESIIPLLDSLTDRARLCQAVNTIGVKDDKLIGHNTDGEGFFHAFCHRFGRPAPETRFLLIGAGGAAKSIAYSLIDRHYPVVISNRTLEKAEMIRGRVAKDRRALLTVRRLAEITPQEFDVVINATSVGMQHNPGIPIPPAFLMPHHQVIDIIYHPQQTQLLTEAVHLGCEVDNGLGMLVWQAAAAWQFWVGKTFDAKRVCQKIKEWLASSPIGP